MSRRLLARVVAAGAGVGGTAWLAFQPTAAPVLAESGNANQQKGLENMRLFTGNANPDLASDISEAIGVKLSNMTVTKFADGEVSAARLASRRCVFSPSFAHPTLPSSSLAARARPLATAAADAAAAAAAAAAHTHTTQVNIKVHDSVRGKDVYVIQPTCIPVNDNLMELFLMISTFRRSSARSVTAVIPYYGYARQDRKMTARVPISAADVARMIEAMGCDRVIAVDLHCGQIQGFFGPRVPVDNLDGGTVGVHYFAGKRLVDPVVVSPDAGGVYRAKRFREGLARLGVESGLAMIVKQRSRPGEVSRMDLVGDIAGKDVVIVDDMIDTAGTLCKAADQLKFHGARRVFAFSSHGLFSGKASKRIMKSKGLEEVVCLDTIPLSNETKTHPKITQLSVAPLIAEAIKRVQWKQSVSTLFNVVKEKK